MKDLRNHYSKFTYMLMGLGESNKSAARLLDLIGANFYCINRGPIDLWSKELPSATPLENLFSEDELTDFPLQPDIIILSPGIPREHPLLKKYIGKIKIWTEIELAYKFVDIPIIGITGSNGKTTTTTILGEMLRNGGVNPFVGGNIGVPFCEMILEEIKSNKKYDLAVLELSSFQLESIEDFSPNVALILNITLNHQERYNGLEDYAQAKFNITKNMPQDSALIYPRDYKIIDHFAQRQQLTVIPFNSFIIQQEFKNKFDLKMMKLKGDHHIQNFYSAYKAINFLELSESGVQKTINEFKGVEYRIEHLEKPRYKFNIYNDAKSSNIDATKTAILSFKDCTPPLYLIYGGFKRNKEIPLDFPDELTSKINKIFLIGETTDEMYDLLMSRGKSLLVEKSYSIENVKKELKKEKKFIGNLLFSPGFPSFDQFKNYEDRGKKFTNLW